MTTLQHGLDEANIIGVPLEVTRVLDFDLNNPVPSGNDGGFRPNLRYVGVFTLGAGQVEAPRMRILTQEEMRQMDPPYPPEEGYDDE